MSRRGNLIVIAGPSGVGKGKLVKELLARDPERLVVSISATTRSPRPEEVDGVDYFFVDERGFDRLVADGDLLEWAEVFGGNRYGTPRGFVEWRRNGGTDVILEIDVQGAAQVREQVPDAILILLEPPSLEELERRLRGRGTERDRHLDERLAKAERELAQAPWFHHRVVNDEVTRAADEVAAIIEAARST
ncbi:MAG TPA: guanylate kinase [Actinomycetota bacterium]|nr:guanylate kinase [Actinomycetota bacterium]